MPNPHGVGFFGGSGEQDGGTGGEAPLGPHGLPLTAEGRLAQLRQDGLFTSTLSVNEFALLTEMGPRPLAQVLGTSVYQVGWQYLSAQAQWGGRDFFCGLEVISQAWDQARRNAFARLREEAREVGADAVVGVRLHRGAHDWAKRTVDFVVNGTAVKLPDAAASPEPDAAPGSSWEVRRGPVLSDLSVQEYWKLKRVGWGPAGLLAATSVYFVSQGFGTRWRRRFSVASNQELSEFSHGFTAARHSAVTQLRGQAQEVGATGIVGVDLQYEIARGKFAVAGIGRTPTGLSPSTIAIGGGELISGRGSDQREGIVFTVHAVGTAIRREQTAGHIEPQPLVGLGGVL